MAVLNYLGMVRFASGQICPFSPDMGATRRLVAILASLCWQDSTVVRWNFYIKLVQ